MKGRVQLVREGRTGGAGHCDVGARRDVRRRRFAGRFRALDQGCCLTDCVVWMVPEPHAQALAMRYPALSWGLLRQSGFRLAQVEDRMEEVAYKRLPERLAGLLLELANGGKAIRGTSHQALADMLGTYRETISAILRSFKDDGLVEIGLSQDRATRCSGPEGCGRRYRLNLRRSIPVGFHRGAGCMEKLRSPVCFGGADIRAVWV